MNFIAQIENYIPKSLDEEAAKKAILSAFTSGGDALLYRHAHGHITVSGVVLNPAMDKTLMVFHNIFKSFSWPGGHADGESDLLAVALREAGEETGIEEVYPLTGQILSLDLLPVSAHERRGEQVSAHIHYSVAYGLIAPENQTLIAKADENSGVGWIELGQSWQETGCCDGLRARCGEPHMIPIYEKAIRRMVELREKKRTRYSKLWEPLLAWYEKEARALPWREEREPYKVWISEIMLQQTRVEAVRRYFQRFLEAFPTIEALAAAEEERLLKLWEGLGYYNRARNLQKAAKWIVAENNGVFPSEYKEMLELPGVGEYTAGAVASICFNQPVPAVDGNVIRVMTRITEQFESMDRPWVKKEIGSALAEVHLTHCGSSRNGDFTQALMELGAMVCLPNGAPKCHICPVSSFCMAYENQTAGLLPRKEKKKPRRIEERTVLVLLRRGRGEKEEQLAVRRREQSGLLAGLWELPNIEGKKSAQEAASLAATWGMKPLFIEKAVSRVHIFTHVEWHMTCYYLRCATAQESHEATEVDRQIWSGESEDVLWIEKKRLEEEIPLPTAFKLFIY